MRSLPFARVAAATAAAAGATLLGVSLGGMAHVDRELAAVAPAPVQTTTFDRVSYLDGAAAERRAARRAACLQRQQDEAVTDGGTPVDPDQVVFHHRRGI